MEVLEEPQLETKPEVYSFEDYVSETPLEEIISTKEEFEQIEKIRNILTHSPDAYMFYHFFKKEEGGVLVQARFNEEDKKINILSQEFQSQEELDKTLSYINYSQERLYQRFIPVFYDEINKNLGLVGDKDQPTAFGHVITADQLVGNPKSQHLNGEKVNDFFPYVDEVRKVAVNVTTVEIGKNKFLVQVTETPIKEPKEEVEEPVQATNDDYEEETTDEYVPIFEDEELVVKKVPSKINITLLIFIPPFLEKKIHSAKENTPLMSESGQAKPIETRRTKLKIESFKSEETSEKVEVQASEKNAKNVVVKPIVPVGLKSPSEKILYLPKHVKSIKEKPLNLIIKNEIKEEKKVPKSPYPTLPLTLKKTIEKRQVVKDVRKDSHKESFKDVNHSVETSRSTNKTHEESQKLSKIEKYSEIKKHTLELKRGSMTNYVFVPNKNAEVHEVKGKKSEQETSINKKERSNTSSQIVFNNSKIKYHQKNVKYKALHMAIEIEDAVTQEEIVFSENWFN